MDRGKGLSSKNRAIFRRQKIFCRIRHWRTISRNLFSALSHFSLATERQRKDDLLRFAAQVLRTMTYESAGEARIDARSHRVTGRRSPARSTTWVGGWPGLVARVGGLTPRLSHQQSVRVAQLSAELSSTHSFASGIAGYPNRLRSRESE